MLSWNVDGVRERVAVAAVANPGILAISTSLSEENIPNWLTDVLCRARCPQNLGRSLGSNALVVRFADKGRDHQLFWDS